MPRITRSAAVLWLILGGIFVWYSYRPIYHSDVWAHLSYGRHYCEIGMLPQTEPLMPLCRNEPFMATAWASQLIGYAAFAFGQHHGIQFLYAATITLAATALAFSLRPGRSIWWPVGAALVFLVLNRDQLIIVRPQLAGVACFCLLLRVLMTTSRQRWSDVVTVAVLFAAWANLHPSFPAGLILITLWFLGSRIDLVRNLGLAGTLKKRSTTIGIATGLIAGVTVLANPYGARLYVEVFRVSGNPNLQALRDWQPLSLATSQGQIALAGTLCVILAHWFTPRRVRARELLPLIVATVGAAWSSRMINWWAPIAAYCLVLHLAAIVSPRYRGLRSKPAEPSTSKWSVIAVGGMAACFASTPFAAAMFGHVTALHEVVSHRTPIAATQYLQQEDEPGLIFAPNTWGDFIVWSGANQPQVFATSHAHVIPRAVWKDYLAVSRGKAEWSRILSDYNVQTLGLDKRLQRRLISHVRTSSKWNLELENRRSVVFRRRSDSLHHEQQM